jgi:hypothetical protein
LLFAVLSAVILTAVDLWAGGRGELVGVDASIEWGGATQLLASTVERSRELLRVAFRVTEAAFLATRALLALVNAAIFLFKVEIVRPLAEMGRRMEGCEGSHSVQSEISSGDARICGGRTEIGWVSVSGPGTGVTTNDGSS